MSAPVNNNAYPVKETKELVQGQLGDRKVSHWQKAKNFLYANRKAFAIALLVVSLATAAIGLGFAVTAGVGAALICTASAGVSGTLLSLAPSATVTVTLGVTLSAALKTLILGSAAFFAGSVMSFGTGGFLVGTAIRRR